MAVVAAGAVIVLLLMLNGFLAMAEIAIVFRAAVGSDSSRTAAVLMREPHWHLRKIQAGISRLFKWA